MKRSNNVTFTYKTATQRVMPHTCFIRYTKTTLIGTTKAAFVVQSHQMKLDSHRYRSYGLKQVICTMLVLFAVLSAENVVVDKRKSVLMISSDEELNEKQIGPLDQYELISSFPSRYSTNKKTGKENLLFVYDNNLWVHCDFSDL